MREGFVSILHTCGTSQGMLLTEMKRLSTRGVIGLKMWFCQELGVLFELAGRN
jgi:hypothetical protein